VEVVGVERRAPLRAHRLRRTERRRVVDHRRPAEAGAGEQPDAAVVRGQRRGVEIEAPIRRKLVSVEVGVLVVRTSLEDDDVESRGREHGRRDGASCTGADHAHVALQERRGSGRLDAPRPYLARRSPRPWVPRHAERPVVGDRRSFPQPLERLALRRDPAVPPGAEDVFALRLRERREPAPASVDERQVPEGEQRKQRGAVRGRHEPEERVGHPRGPRARAEGLADRLERDTLSRGHRPAA
jgi:hypothetical protein